MNDNQRLKSWASTLTESQAKTAIVELVEQLIIYEQISYWGDAVSPYWSNTGEPVVPGQKTHPDE